MCAPSQPSLDMDADDDDMEVEGVAEDRELKVRKNYRGKPYNPVDLATSMEYLKSDVYRDTYLGKPVWFYYRRNFRGHFAPPTTRRNCVKANKLVSSNPCPICRDEYLVLDYRHTDLLVQFVDPITAKILDCCQTGLCRAQHKRLLLEIEKAQDLGTVEMYLPFHVYNYSEYYSYLPPDKLSALLYASGSVTPDDPTNVHKHLSLEEFTSLPANVQDLLKDVDVIPHARGGKILSRETEIERPKVPSRYHMEEDHKKRVARIRKSRTLILE